MTECFILAFQWDGGGDDLGEIEENFEPEELGLRKGTSAFSGEMFEGVPASLGTLPDVRGGWYPASGYQVSERSVGDCPAVCRVAGADERFGDV